MDEVDIDNVDDLNELEARLYAQIHHESTDIACDYNIVEAVPAPVTVRTVTSTSVVNKKVGDKTGRYWSGGSSPKIIKAVDKDIAKEKPVVEPPKPTHDVVVVSQVAGNCSSAKNKSQVELSAEASNAASSSGSQVAAAQNAAVAVDAAVVVAAVVQCDAPQLPNKPATQSTGQNCPKTKDKKQILQLKQNKDLRVNPAASWMVPKTKASKKSQQQQQRQSKQPPLPPNMLKDGPFAKQVQKLNKAMRMEAKKQKSKASKAVQRKQAPVRETIVLESSDESTSDVIEIPLPPAPTYTIEDSDESDEAESKKSNILHIMEENAQDAADIVLEQKCFIKPHTSQQQQQQQPPQQNLSRCTSPCSVLSSDDFIGQTDQCRLLQGAGMADDEDLALLTADVDSLMENPNTKQQPQQSCAIDLDKDEQQAATDASSSDLECTEFAPSHNDNIYRVDQTQFRAVDVYDSESDMGTGGVYGRAKIKEKETIIRAVDSSSSSAENSIELAAVALQSKPKRLRKRRTTATVSQFSSDSEADATHVTGLSYISQGPAVERRTTKIRRESHSSSSRRGTTGGGSVGNMSDNEFIATLNCLAQGGNDVDNDEEYSDGDVPMAPSARAIAEQVLAASSRRATQSLANEAEDEENLPNEEQYSANEDESNTADNADETNAALAPTADANVAVTNELLSDLDKVFETIDQMDKRRGRNEPLLISDASDVEMEVVDITQAVPVAAQAPTPAAAIVVADVEEVVPEPIPAPNESGKRRFKINKKTGDIVYNIVYSEDHQHVGGIGWNDEMRRFYNNSWKGETFNLRKIRSQMDGKKTLWKVYTEDRFPKARRFMNLKCNNCCEFGHTRAKCTRPKKPLTCYMCGQLGHYEPRCPNTVCLRCGNKTHVFTKSCNACSFQNRMICPVCKVRGHTLNLCPDKWRRYHSTTKPNAYPNSQVEYKTKKWCCICGSRGHLYDTCRSAVRILEYPIFVTEIKSHQKSYNDQALKSLETGIGYNMLYKPEVDVSFELAENTNSQDYYGRFLTAVGMAYLLKRKRKSTVIAANSPIKKRKLTRERYIVNPYSKAAQATRNQTEEPEQVQEISESGNVEESADDNADVETTNILDVNIDLEEAHEITSLSADEEAQAAHSEDTAFKTPTIVAAIAQELATEETADEPPVPMDSDSNYSFSEHFELPSCSTAQKKDPPPKKKSREMGPLDDFIPLTNANDASDDDENEDADEDDNEDVDRRAGISRRYVTANSDDDDEDNSRVMSPLPDLPCEAKIYLTHFHSKYLLSPAGHEFLVQKSTDCDIKARLDWTSVGHVLIIFGMQTNQDKFHRELLLKYRELSDQMNRKRLESSQRLPRRVDVLIRVLRENITQLMSNLGNVNELVRRLKQLEQQQSKNGWKSAEKARRSLNMILLGQAGLRDGNFHLDKLLLSLQRLINDYKGADNASDELREEIDTHWKTIFTSYRHDNYPELVKHYNKMLTKNRLPQLNIDPLLLGERMLDTQLTKEQRIALEKTPVKENNKQSKNVGHLVPNPLNPSNAKRCHTPPPAAPSMKTLYSPNSTAPPAPPMKLNKGNQTAVRELSFVPTTPTLTLKKNVVALATTTATPTKAATAPTVATTTPKTTAAARKGGRPTQPPFANPQQKSTVATKIASVTQKWETTCNSLLNELDDGKPKKGPVLDCKAPSMFWSRECMKFIDECIHQVSNNPSITEKLQRVQTKSKNGLLSYNDYRAVIKLRNAIFGK